MASPPEDRRHSEYVFILTMGGVAEPHRSFSRYGGAMYFLELGQILKYEDAYTSCGK